MTPRPHPHSVLMNGSRVALKGVRGVKGTVTGFDGYVVLVRWDGYSFNRRHALDDLELL